MAIVVSVAVATVLLLGRLVTEVDAEAVRLSYLPLGGRTIPLDEIASHHVVDHRPIRHFGGWGVRWGGRRGWAWIASGHRGVRLELRTWRPVLIGSQRPDELDRAIADAIRERAGR